jgi:hypothetical protein
MKPIENSVPLLNTPLRVFNPPQHEGRPVLAVQSVRPNRDDSRYLIVSVYCPACRCEHTHGSPAECDLSVPSHRSAHCVGGSPFRDGGYFIHRPKPVSNFELTSNDPRDAEQEIVWLCDPALMPYVREIPWGSARRTTAPGKRQLYGSDLHQIVGFSVLGPSAKSINGVFPRRMFVVKLHDRILDPNGTYSTSYPAEAVDPLTVKPRVRGEKTERMKGLALNA